MKQIVKALLSRLLGKVRLDRLLGWQDYYRYPGMRGQFGGPLNGSKIRQEVFAALKERCGLRAAVETGTYRGDTCEFLADSGLAVYSVELSQRYFGFARARMGRRKNVHLYQGDSRSFLTTLANDPTIPRSHVFFYLDAHWYDDLPLREEVEIILSHWTDSVIMIDDFQVPGDPGYHYDDYGSGRALTKEYLQPLAHLGFTLFFPADPSGQETGVRRGWTLLAKDAAVVQQMRSLPRLREEAVV